MEENVTNNIETDNSQEEILEGPAVVEKINLSEVNAEKERANQELAMAERERIDKIFKEFFEAFVNLSAEDAKFLQAELAEKKLKKSEKN